MAYELSKEAEQDLHDIWEYIAEDNPNAADAAIETIYKAIRKLSDFPRLGHKRSDIETNRPTRFWTALSHYQIVYLDHVKPLRVVRIVSGYRDLVSLFGEDEHQKQNDE